MERMSLSKEINRVIEPSIEPDDFDEEALRVYIINGPEDLKCWVCERPIDYCHACGVPCSGEDGPLCEDHIDDDDLISPEEAEWMKQHLIKIPLFPPLPPDQPSLHF